MSERERERKYLGQILEGIQGRADLDVDFLHVFRQAHLLHSHLLGRKRREHINKREVRNSPVGWQGKRTH